MVVCKIVIKVSSNRSIQKRKERQRNCLGRKILTEYQDITETPLIVLYSGNQKSYIIALYPANVNLSLTKYIDYIERAISHFNKYSKRKTKT